MAKASETPAPALQQTPARLRPVKKLTVRDILGGAPNIKAIINHDEANPGAELWLVEIIGIATAYRPGTVKDTGQPYIRFLGSFQGTNLETGQMFQSGSCILPGAIPDLLFGALQMGNAVQFGFKIGVKFEQKAATKYVYVVESMTEQSSTDPLAQLANAIRSGGAMPQLPPLAGTVALPAEIGKSNKSGAES